MVELGLLEQANAALRLGDLFAPPVGSVISMGPGGKGYAVLSEMREGGGFDPGRTGRFSRIHWAFVMVAANAPRGPTFAVHLDSIHELLEVPEGSPPFDQWERPTNGRSRYVGTGKGRPGLG